MIKPRYKKVASFSRTHGEDSKHVWIWTMKKNLHNMEIFISATDFLSKELNLKSNSDYLIEDDGERIQLLIKRSSFFDRSRRKYGTSWELEHIYKLMVAFIKAKRYSINRPYA